MKDIIEPVDTDDGLFHDGDPSTGAEGTIVYAKIMNALQGGLISAQSEIKTILTEAGLKPDANSVSQLLTALKNIFITEESEIVKDALQKGNNLSDVKDKALSRSNLELRAAAIRDVADNAPGALVPVGYKGNFSSDSNHGAIDFATYPFVVGESLFIDTRGCTNNPPFVSQDFYYIDVVCATGPSQGGRVNRPLVQFVSYTTSKLILAIREDDGSNIGWRYFTAVQYDADNNTVTIPGALKAANGGAELSQNAINIRGTGNKHLWFFNAAGVEMGLVYASDDKVLHLRAGVGPSVNIQSNGNVVAPNYLEAKDDIHSGRNISSVGIIQAGQGLYDTPGVRAYSPNNPPPQQDLSSYAPISWVNSNFLQGVRKGAKGTANSNQSSDRFARVPDGASVVSVYNENTYIAVEYRYDQYNLGGTWYNVGAV